MTILVNTANPVKFDLKRGSTFYKTILVKDSNGDPVDLSSVTFTSAIKPEYDLASVASFTIVPIDLANGEFGIKIPAATTANFGLYGQKFRKSYIFDLDFTFGNGDKFTYLNGYINVTRHV